MSEEKKEFLFLFFFRRFFLFLLSRTTKKEREALPLHSFLFLFIPEGRSFFFLHLAAMLLTDFEVDSPNVTRTDDVIEAMYDHETTRIEMPSGGEGKPVIRPTKQLYTFRTKTKVPKLG